MADVKIKKSLTVMILLIIFSYLLWQVIRPVEIVAAHDGDTLLVKHFPFSKIRQINWWEKNKSMIKEKYDVPRINRFGYYSVFIHEFGNGYREDQGFDQDTNLLCFDEMKTKVNCIDKKPLLNIGSSPNTKIYYR